MFLGAKILIIYHFPPFQIAKNCNNNIKGVERGLERDVFVEIEYGGDDIDGNPNEPLFQVLMRQSPDADNAQGGGERVGQGDVGVGERD